MKNKMKSTIFAMVLCLSLVLSLSACGGGGASGGASMDGKWVISSMTIDGEDYLAMIAEMAGELDDEIDIENMMFCEFTSGDSFKMVMYDEEESGTYKLSGKTLTLTVDGESLTGTMDGNSFTISDDSDGSESRMTFTKK